LQLLHQQLAALSQHWQSTQQQGMSAVVEASEAPLDQRRCPQFLSAALIGLLDWVCAAAAMPSRDVVLCM